MNDYQSAGVDTVKAANFISKVAPLIRSTQRTGSDANVGGFGGFFDLKSCGYKDPLLVAATDGVGTKLRLAIDMCAHDTIGIDLVAMCVNDLIVQGAEPLFFLDYFAQGELLPAQDMQDIVAGIVAGCHESGCALIGGETAEMPGMYQKGDYDLAGFSVGAVERDQVISPANIQVGDILLGLPSSGFHSNGYSLIRKIIADMELNDPAPFAPGVSLGKALLEPTKIYVRSLLPVRQHLRGLWHITGGGFYENLERGVPEGLSININQTWNIPSCFQWLAQKGKITSKEMFSTFNMGIGMVGAVKSEHVSQLCSTLDAVIIGEVSAQSKTDEHKVIINDQCFKDLES